MRRNTTMIGLTALTLLLSAAGASQLHSRNIPSAFAQPPSKAIDYVDPYVSRS